MSNLGPKDVVLTDFGVSRVGHDAVQQMFPDRVPGLADYLSPDLCRRERGIDSRADVYSLGAVLYELLTGTVPFGGGVPSKVMQMQMNEPLRLPRSLRPDLPEEVEQVVLKALEKDRDRRFYDAEAFGLAVKQRMGHVKAPLQFAPMPAAVPGRGKAPSDRGTAVALPSSRPSPGPIPAAGQAPAPAIAAQEEVRRQGPAVDGKSGGGGMLVLLVVVLLVLLAVVGVGVWWLFLR
ncbi:MAG: protein kinase [Chloroflexaceae bacterium]|nr:protein kinase [Chloroflexaceae bacterium]